MEKILSNIMESLHSEEIYNKEHSRIYKIHKYWARKPWYIVEKYIKKYSAVGDLVMDPFCGSGCTGLEAVINGRNFIGQDLNPTAIQVTKGTLLSNINLKELQGCFDEIDSVCKERIMTLYLSERKCDKCEGPMHYKHCNIGPAFKDDYQGSIYCPVCNSKGRKIKLSDDEVKKMADFDNFNIEKWFPKKEFPKKFYKDRFSYKGILTVADMYTKRNLYALSLIHEEIQKKEEPYKSILMLAFTNTVLHVSKLKGENVRPLGVNNYWVPDDYIEENVWFRFSDRFNNLLTAKKQQIKREKEKSKENITAGTWVVERKSALENMGSESVDYFFTDPPYGDAIQYSELSYVWNAWLEEDYEIDEEVIINPIQNKGAKEFNDLLTQALDNIYLASKDEHYFTLCFQNKNSEIWKDLIRYCKNIGLKLVDVSIYDTYGSPFNKSWANFSPKSDIYVTFKKSKIPSGDFYCKEETLISILEDIKKYMQHKQIQVDYNKLYDITISYIIWAAYLNESEINIKGFNIKSFSKVVDQVFGEN